MTGNKGAVAVWFKFFKVQFLFVNCHLAAGQFNSEKRNQDFMRILESINYEVNKRNDYDARISFYMGDFNYRIDHDLNFIAECIQENKINDILRHDQMNKEIDQGKLDIDGLKEEKINFHPTYKFNAGTNEYSFGNGDKVPGWTDRIL
jgi:synaptojanin